jgi:tRNA(Leu) C34 or U34 (ribose-2'-O)-methylase TrmL
MLCKICHKNETDSTSGICWECCSIYKPNYEQNIGTIIRTAYNFCADFIAIIGGKYKKQPSDTYNTDKHIPTYEYPTLEDFIENLPLGCIPITIEVDGNENLENFIHPLKCVYIFGPENSSVPQRIKKRIKIETRGCLNLAVCVGIVMYDRYLKSKKSELKIK